MMTSANNSAPNTPLARLLVIVVAVALPALLVLTGVRLVMTETFLRFEYNRPGFPADRYGFTTEDRLEYGPYGVRYLRQNRDISYLANLQIDGEPLFREKELRHMEDVQAVTRAAVFVQRVLLVVFLAVFLGFGRSPHTAAAVRQGLVVGGIITLASIATLLILIAASWDLFFDSFHGVFFAGDSWQFRTSDTLIRLYPEQFWFDAALTIGALTAAGALIAIGGVWWWERRHSGHPRANQNGADEGPAERTNPV